MLKIKNLELKRETLRNLNQDEQNQVQGGGLAARCSSESASIITTRRIYCC